MKLFKNITLLQLTASISALVVALSIGYYFAFHLPSVERANQEIAERELLLKETEVQQQKSEADIYEDCDVEAQTRASSLLKSKLELAENSNLTYTQEYKVWKEASEKGLFLKDDYNELYNACIRRQGIKY